MLTARIIAYPCSETGTATYISHTHTQRASSTAPKLRRQSLFNSNFHVCNRALSKAITNCSHFRVFSPITFIFQCPIEFIWLRAMMIWNCSGHRLQHIQPVPWLLLGFYLHFAQSFRCEQCEQWICWTNAFRRINMLSNSGGSRCCSAQTMEPKWNSVFQLPHGFERIFIFPCSVRSHSNVGNDRAMQFRSIGYRKVLFIAQRLVICWAGTGGDSAASL